MSGGPTRYRTLAVTGGTGFVGQHLLRMARAAGHDVRALTRGWKPPEEGLVWIDGALDRPDALARLADGTDAIVHVAGRISGTPAEFEAVNVAGTAAMIDAARGAGVRRFIHISSLAAREPGISLYGRSKARSELLVAASGLDWTILRPPAVYGPGDKETLELFKMARRGLVALPPGGRFSVLHVEDLCRLILATLDADESWSETYEPDDGTPDGWAHHDFATALGQVYGKKPRAIAMPRAVMNTAARIDGLVRGSRAKLTPDRVGYFCHADWVAAGDRRPPRTLWKPAFSTSAGLTQTAAWYASEGWIW